MHGILAVLVITIITLIAGNSAYEPSEVCFSPEEMELFNNINAYRQKKGLKAIPASAALTYVAQVHAKDLYNYYEESRRCNLHSWSKNGPWEPCCYTDNHRKAECMWFKPAELTGFDGVGYEMVYYSTYPGDVLNMQVGALEGWKNSRKHHEMILNKDIWKQVEWEAMGVAIHKTYAVVWFSDSPDSGKIIQVCD